MDKVKTFVVQVDPASSKMAGAKDACLRLDELVNALGAKYIKSVADYNLYSRHGGGCSDDMYGIKRVVVYEEREHSSEYGYLP